MSSIDIRTIPTTPPDFLDKDEIKKETKALTKELARLQHILYAEQKRSILVVLQGMDASGKDGAMRKVFRYCSPAAVWAIPFKKPTEKEMRHDFLWRVHQWVPEKGMIRIFNRSHYEDILIQKVYDWIDDDQRTQRMASINHFEQLLQNDNQTSVMKFYLHISKDQQAIELQQRLDEPDKHWKHNDNDWKEREKWDDYMDAYNYVFNHSTIPWHIIPVDKRWYRDYLISKAVVEQLRAFDLKHPELKTGNG